MNNVTVIGRRKLTYIGPSQWADLTPRQFQQFMNWQLNQEAAEAGKFALLSLWYRMPYLVLRALSDEQRLELTQYLSFTQTPPTKWLIPTIRINFRHYSGPGDNLANLPFGAFIFAEASAKAYYASSERQHLVDLAACLYVATAFLWPRSESRQKFSRQSLAGLARRFTALPETTLHGIYLCYVGAKQPFPRQFSALYPTASKEGTTDTTWLDIGLGLARQTGALGTFDQMNQQPTYLVLKMLDQMIQEAEKLKAQLTTP